MDVLEQGWQLFELDQFNEAEAKFQTVLKGSESTPEQRRQAQFGLGYCAAFAGHFAQSRQMFQILRQDAAERQDQHAEHRALHQLGMVERMAGNWMAAQQCFHEEQFLLQTLGNDALAVSVNAYEQGFVALHLRQMGAALDWFTRCLDQAEQSGDFIAIGCAHRGLGDYWQHEDSETAWHHWETALTVFDEAGDLKAVQEMRERLSRLSKLRTSAPLETSPST